MKKSNNIDITETSAQDTDSLQFRYSRLVPMASSKTPLLRNRFLLSSQAVSESKRDGLTWTCSKFLSSTQGWISDMHVCPTFPAFLPFLRFGFFSKMERQTLHQSSQAGCFSQFLKGITKNNNFSKNCGYFDYKVKTNLTTCTFQRLF